MEQPDEVVVRPADVHDASGIAEVHVRSWQEAYAGIVPDSYLADLDPHERAPVWADLLSRGPADDVRTWVAVVGDRIVGFASLGPGRDEDSRRADREIYSMYLSPEQWGRGVARELMRTVIAEAGAGRRLVLWVMADNQRAQHFWRRHGFQPDGIEKYEDVGGAELLEVRYRRG
ncbi:GNAT family N-acetyltransferase [Cellulomonas sp. SG140]|uniref:GNAT family N-acetyltransferase n=1 Tax=Cellulomonas sp. SG140 TaxID=2976536 RepID=UPI0021E9227F|nr:GNAT family N-acetyltransferase [Cellulomonas sp. SG140]